MNALTTTEFSLAVMADVTKKSFVRNLVRTDIKENVQFRLYDDETGIIKIISPESGIKKVFCYSDLFDMDWHVFTAYMGYDFNGMISVARKSFECEDFNFQFMHIDESRKSSKYKLGSGKLKYKSVDEIESDLVQYHKENIMMNALNKLSLEKIYDIYHRMVCAVPDGSIPKFR